MVLALTAIPWVNEYGPAYGISQVHGVSVAVVAVAAAGGAMLPDFDHAHATIAQSLGPVTKVLASIIGALSGGHRNGTHSLVGVAFFVAVSTFFGTVGGYPLGLWLAFLFAVGAAAMRVTMTKTPISHMVLCLIGGAALVYTSKVADVPLAAVNLGVGIGAVAHLLGDMLTRQGVPPLWPVVKTRFKVAELTTNAWTERVVVGPGLAVAAVGLVLVQSGAWTNIKPVLSNVAQALPGLG